MKENNGSDGYHHGNLREVLLETALEVIEERGAKGLTIREVSRRAGVSHMAPYRHFKNKEILLGELAKQGFETMMEETRKRFKQCGDDPLMRFKVCGVSYIDFAIHHPAHYMVMFGPGKIKKKESKGLREASLASFQMLTDCIKASQDKGLIRPGDPMEMALAAWSIVHGFAMLFIHRHVKEGGIFNKKVTEMMDIVTNSLYFGLMPQETESNDNAEYALANKILTNTYQP